MSISVVPIFLSLSLFFLSFCKQCWNEHRSPDVAEYSCIIISIQILLGCLRMQAWSVAGELRQTLNPKVKHTRTSNSFVQFLRVENVSHTFAFFSIFKQHHVCLFGFFGESCIRDYLNSSVDIYPHQALHSRFYPWTFT